MTRDLGQIKAEAEATVPPLVSGILEDTQTLLRQEMQLARAEIKQDMKSAREAALAFGISAAVGGLAVLLLSFGLVALLSWLTLIPMWGSYAIVGGIYAAAAAVSFYQGHQAYEQTDFVPRRTVETMKENAQWIAGT